jgi:uncharacterized protein YabN with tetrapyrrole methylase and pyrophosphatase domain
MKEALKECINIFFLDDMNLDEMNDVFENMCSSSFSDDELADEFNDIIFDINSISILYTIYNISYSISIHKLIKEYIFEPVIYYRNHLMDIN